VGSDHQESRDHGAIIFAFGCRLVLPDFFCRIALTATSVNGTKLTWRRVSLMSAFGGIADIAIPKRHVCLFEPKRT
jgi:hypothetical protein